VCVCVCVRPGTRGACIFSFLGFSHTSHGCKNSACRVAGPESACTHPASIHLCVCVHACMYVCMYTYVMHQAPHMHRIGCPYKPLRGQEYSISCVIQCAHAFECVRMCLCARLRAPVSVSAHVCVPPAARGPCRTARSLPPHDARLDTAPTAVQPAQERATLSLFLPVVRASGMATLADSDSQVHKCLLTCA
jgi:hypothetical protein